MKTFTIKQIARLINVSQKRAMGMRQAPASVYLHGGMMSLPQPNCENYRGRNAVSADVLSEWLINRANDGRNTGKLSPEESINLSKLLY